MESNQLHELASKDNVIVREGFNCFGCKHRHSGKSLAWICIGCPCPFVYCEGCQTVIDPETCGCGSPIESHGYDNHTAVPMGCGCYRHDAETDTNPFA